MQFVDLHTQYRRIENDVKRRIEAVLQHGRFIQGPEVNALEERLADYLGVKHAIAVSSGTDALLLALMALDIKPGDEVITTPFSFIATAEMIALLGAKPVFVDIDAATYALDAAQIEQAITARSKAILPVSLFGQCADFDTINAVAEKHGLAVIEDAAQSFGASYKGRCSGNLCTLATTSFYPSKPLGCYGDGGACFTNDMQLAKALRELREHGQNGRYKHARIGLNGRLDSMQAAILLAKLEILDDELDARSRVAAHYDRLLADIVQTPYIAPYNRSVYAQYTIEVDNRARIQEQFAAHGIPTAVHYPVPLHQQPAFEHSGELKFDLPNAETAAKRVLSLPMHSYLDEPSIQKIADVLALAGFKRVGVDNISPQNHAATGS